MSGELDKRCDCGVGEAGNDKPRTARQIEEACMHACSCGGGEPGHCCPACQMWHYLYPSEKAERKAVAG